ncbi:MAG TPA: hypothetical protein VLG47_06795 [Candidatus Saccharimonadales bacterium]|nr:hypothetical protein [Candidatus Saccharimonadales bacterium]
MRRNFSRSIIFMLFAMLTVQFLAVPAVSAVDSGAISQGFTANSSNVAPGTIVSLVSGKSLVAPSNTKNVSNIVGVADEKPLVELSGSGTNSVQVVVNGTVKALVSDVNGDIKTGDKITASPLDGIGMKATTPTEIVGTAQANLSSVPTVNKKVESSDGKISHQAKVGLLPIVVNVAYYTTSSQGGVSSFVPPFLQTVANAVSGHQVSPLHVLLGALGLMLGFATAVIMLYVSIKSGVISIGRNPLAEGALRKGLVDVVIAAMGVLVITVVAVYIILLS